MADENVIIKRSGVDVILPKAFYELWKSEGKYICANRQRNTRGFRYDVMVCKKAGERMVFRKKASRLILEAPAWIHIDHIDRNPLNNAISNLRLATHRENSRNRTKAAGKKFRFMGIKQKHSHTPYYATIGCEGVRYSVGPFKTEEDAARAYDKMAKWLFGEFAALNFPEPRTA